MIKINIINLKKIILGLEIIKFVNNNIIMIRKKYGLKKKCLPKKTILHHNLLFSKGVNM